MEGEYYFAFCPKETFQHLIVEKTKNGFWLMGSEQIYSDVDIIVIEKVTRPNIALTARVCQAEQRLVQAK